MNRPIRVLIAKVGLDGHDRGAWVLMEGLRKAGMKVFYTGRHVVPEQIVAQAQEEQVDVLGISCLSGAHNHYLPLVAQALAKPVQQKQLCLLAGGIIPQQDHAFLKSWGYEKIFTPGSTLAEIISYIENWCERNKRLKNNFAHVPQ